MTQRFTFSFSKAVFLANIMFAMPAAIAVYTAPALAASSISPASSTPQAPISQLYDALNKAEHSGSDISKRIAMITPAVEQTFDMNAILKRSIGLHYDSLAENERNDLVAAFKRFTVARYASTFKPGTDAAFVIAPSTEQTSSGKTLVHTTIGNKAAPATDATPIDYVMVHNDAGWQITDILLNGHISQVSAQRADFKAIFNQSGASGLARTLIKKADDFLHE